MRVQTRRIALALAFTAVIATSGVLLAEQVSTKPASPRLIAPAAVLVEVGQPKLIASEVMRDPGYWYPPDDKACGPNALR